MNLKENLVIVGGARTAMTEYAGTPGYGMFADTGANQLGAYAIGAALERAGVNAEQVDHVVMGNLISHQVPGILAIPQDSHPVGQFSHLA